MAESLVLGDSMKQPTYNHNAVYFIKLQSPRSKPLAFRALHPDSLPRAYLFQALRLYLQRRNHA